MAYLGSTPARAPLSSAQIEDGTVDTADLATNAVTTAKITAGNVTTAKLAASSALIGKNILINGSHEVAQRSAAVTGMGAASGYTQVDMWHIIASGTAGRVTGSQVAGPLAATGHAKAVKIDVTTADSSVASGDIMSLRTTVEAINLQQLQWGVATAKSVTVSFWMKSPKSGTHCVSIYQEDDGRFFIKEFTIASADTYEYFAITFPGDTGGVIDTNNGAGIRIDWPLICGSGEAGSADAWTSGGKFATSNQQNLLDNTSNNVELAGVQLELGTVATDFEHEPISVTLAKCQRYYQQWNITTAFGYIASGLNAGATTTRATLPTRQTMRAAPTLSVSGVGDFQTQDATGAVDTSNVTLYSSYPEVVIIEATVASQPISNAAMFGADNSTARFLALSAEL